MWARFAVLGMVAGCYAPDPTLGAPCSPVEPHCPQHQTCALVAGSYACVEGPVGDAAVERPDAEAAPLAPWTLVQTRATMSSNLPISRSGAGHLIIVAIETTATEPVTAVTDNAANLYVAIPGSRATNTGENLGLELWYATSVLPDASRIMVDAPTVYAIAAWEVSGIRTTDPLDTVTTLDDQPTTTTPLGAPITTTRAGAFVVSVAIVANSVSGIHAGNAFENDHRTYGNGWAHLADPAAPAGTYQAQWDQQVTGPYCASSAAFFLGI